MSKKLFTHSDTIYVKWHEDSREPFRELEDDPTMFAIPGETVRVAEYKLVAIRKVTAPVEVK